MAEELYYCQDCEDANRRPTVQLDNRLRCEVCGSDQVVSVERLLQAARQHAPLVGAAGKFLLISRRVA